MGLDITVGDFAKYLIEDPEFAEELRADFQKICDRLIGLGFDGWTEPKTLPIKSEPIWLSYGYFSRLKIKFAYIKEDIKHLDTEFSEDINFNESICRKWSILSLHLMYHSPYEGYYVPVDFPEAIEIPTLMNDPLVGSSIRLLQELEEIALHLDINIDGDNISERELERIIQSLKTIKPLQKSWIEKVANILEYLTPMGIAMKLLRGDFIEKGELLDDLSIAKLVWLELYEKARFSKLYQTTICFS